MKTHGKIFLLALATALAYPQYSNAQIWRSDLSLSEYSQAEVLAMSPEELLSFGSEQFLELDIELLNRYCEEHDISMEDMVSSASKSNETLTRAPVTMVLLDERTLFLRGHYDWESPMHDLPGFDISRSNGNLYTHLYQRGYRSNNTNRTLLLIDGSEQNDLWSGNVYLSRQYSMTDIKSVEVIYGPASTMYGNNAFLGTINWQTKRPIDYIQPGSTVGGLVEAGYGSWNSRYIDATVAGRSQELPVSASLTVRRFESDEMDLTDKAPYGFAMPTLDDALRQTYRDALRINDPVLVADFLGRNDQHPYFEQLDGIVVPTQAGIEHAYALDAATLADAPNTDLTRTLSLHGKLVFGKLTVGAYYWEKDEGPGSQYANSSYGSAAQGANWSPKHSLFYARYDNQLSDELRVVNFTRFKVHTFDTDNRIVRFRDYRYSEGRRLDLQDLLLETPTRWDSAYLFQKSSQMRNETMLIWAPGQRFNWVNGFEFRSSAIQGDYLVSATADAEETGAALSQVQGGNVLFSNDFGFYSQARYSLSEHFSLVGGLRLDHNQIRLEQGYGTVLTPRVALLFHPGDLVVKLIYAEAFKDATNREKYSTAAGKRELTNPYLEPERARNFELNIGRNFVQVLQVNLSAYRASYSDIVQEVFVPAANTNQNQAMGEMAVWGINAWADYKLGQWNLFANYTFTDPRNLSPVDENGQALTDEDGQPIDELRVGDIAEHQFNLGANYNPFEPFNINLRAKYVGQRQTGQGTSVSTSPLEAVDPNLVLNAALTYDLPWGVTAQLVVNNLLDNEYFAPGLFTATQFDSSLLLQNARNFMFRLRWDF